MAARGPRRDRFTLGSLEGLGNAARFEKPADSEVLRRLVASLPLGMARQNLHVPVQILKSRAVKPKRMRVAPW